MIPKDQYHADSALVGMEVETARGSVTVVTQSGERYSGQMLVAADG